MIPDGNNVYGHIVSSQGLQPVLRAMKRLIGEDRAYIYKSQFNGTETLHFDTDSIQLHSTPLEESGRHLLNGGVGGSLEDVVKFVGAMSRLLAEEGIEHSFEVYDADYNLVEMIPG
jgi:hypothetical protein